jgi:hypothetical protein
LEHFPSMHGLRSINFSILDFFMAVLSTVPSVRIPECLQEANFLSVRSCCNGTKRGEINVVHWAYRTREVRLELSPSHFTMTLSLIIRFGSATR